MKTLKEFREATKDMPDNTILVYRGDLPNYYSPAKIEVQNLYLTNYDTFRKDRVCDNEVQDCVVLL